MCLVVYDYCIFVDVKHKLKLPLTLTHYSRKLNSTNRNIIFIYIEFFSQLAVSILRIKWIVTLIDIKIVSPLSEHHELIWMSHIKLKVEAVALLDNQIWNTVRYGIFQDVEGFRTIKPGTHESCSLHKGMDHPAGYKGREHAL